MEKVKAIENAQKTLTNLLFNAIKVEGYEISERRFGEYQKHVAVRNKDGEEFTVRLSVVHGDVFGMLKKED